MDLESALPKYPKAFPYPVGDSAKLNAEILALMRSGVKTGTCDVWAIYEDGTEELPVVGRVNIALNWAGEPVIATRTLAVERILFDAMDETRVQQQGEFRDLAHWLLEYEAYLTQAG